MAQIHPVVKDTFDLLTFRISREAILRFGWLHLIFGLTFTWVVGVGRYWDNPRAELVQHLGLGSLIYVVNLSYFLWITILLLSAKDWNYFRVLTFVSLVSPPALLYAIPVQFWFDLDTANWINSVFLLLVASWRLALLIFFLRVFAQLSWFSVIVSGVFSMTLIIAAISYLNLERVVFDFMRGVSEPSPNDLAYEILLNLTFFSVLIFPFALFGFIIAIILNIIKKDK